MHSREAIEQPQPRGEAPPLRPSTTEGDRRRLRALHSIKEERQKKDTDEEDAKKKLSALDATEAKALKALDATEAKALKRKIKEIPDNLDFPDQKNILSPFDE